MKNSDNQILRSNEDKSIRIVGLNNFKTDAGWQENMEELEKETLEQVLNPAQNYETVRYIHSPYSGITSSNSKTQSDIWFYFYFLSGTTYVQNYEPTGLTLRENMLMLKQSTESFFRLEFFKTPNDETPSRSNRRLVFTKNLSLPIGEKVFYTGENLNEYVFVPVFMGSNYKNKENMYLFWFQDDSVFDETTLTGNTFWMTAKYYNAKEGTITDFVTSCLSTSTEINETTDMYYKVVIDRSDYSYQVFRYDGSVGERIGERNDPILFYQTGGGINCVSPTPTPTPTTTPPPQSPTPTPTITPSITPSAPIGDFVLSPSYGISMTALSVSGGQSLPTFTFPVTGTTQPSLSMVQGYSAGTTFFITLNGTIPPYMTLNVSLIKNSVTILDCTNITTNPSYQTFSLSTPGSLTINDDLRISIGGGNCP